MSAGQLSGIAKRNRFYWHEFRNQTPRCIIYIYIYISRFTQITMLTKFKCDEICRWFRGTVYFSRLILARAMHFFPMHLHLQTVLFQHEFTQTQLWINTFFFKLIFSLKSALWKRERKNRRKQVQIFLCLRYKRY